MPAKNPNTIRVAAWYDDVKQGYWQLLKDDLKSCGIAAKVTRQCDDVFYTITFKNKPDMNFYIIAGQLERLPKFKRGAGMYRVRR